MGSDDTVMLWGGCDIKACFERGWRLLFDP